MHTRNIAHFDLRNVISNIDDSYEEKSSGKM